MGGAIQIEAKDLARTTDDSRHAPLLQPTRFTLHMGDRVAITGSSGSGKSVLLRTLALLDAPSAGQVLWQGQPIGGAQIPRYRSRVCYLSQRPALLDGSVEDNLRFPYSLKSNRHLTFDIAVVQRLLDRAGKAAEFLTKTAGDLSGGEAQIVSLIRTLQLDPDVLLLDEPTAALDPTSAQEVEKLIHAWFDGSAEHAYIWISHDLAQAQRMGRIHLHMHAGVLTGPEQA